ncbi:hypothetical protein AB0D04_00805 [Streptomyces sp. NPDC048483]|uniref:hypothetical protein n=1 Tax=Streptomyces sp. NPDC048483 TaxID=3154927 RepID=UPI0034342E8F
MPQLPRQEPGFNEGTDGSAVLRDLVRAAGWTPPHRDREETYVTAAVVEDEEDDDSRDYVAGCPLTPQLVQEIVGLAELDWEDWEAADAAMRRLGWRDDESPLEASFVTGVGHLVFGGDGCFYMPFAHAYCLGCDFHGTEDFRGDFPGWSSQADAGRDVLDAHVNAAVDRFAERLGPPHRDGSKQKLGNETGEYLWRFAAWRIGGNLLVVGQGLDALSYYQDEHALVCMGPLSPDAPIPDIDGLADFVC